MSRKSIQKCEPVTRKNIQTKQKWEISRKHSGYTVT